MNKEDLKNNESYRHPDETTQEQPIEHETDKTAQRQGGIDKKGEREKDEKGEF